MRPLRPTARADRLLDRDRLEQLVAADYRAVWRLCTALVGEDSADDVAQETFLRALRALPRFRGHATPRTWLLAIAHRACMDELRSRYRRGRRDQRLAGLFDAQATTADPGAAVATRQLLAQLGPERRAAFVLTQLLALSYAEAAAVCDCPEGTIRSRVARARQDLIELLTETSGAAAGSGDRRQVG